MNCNILGFRNCGKQYLYYLDDLAGISLNKAEGIRDGDLESYVLDGEKYSTLAAGRIKSDLYRFGISVKPSKTFNIKAKSTTNPYTLNTNNVAGTTRFVKLLNVNGFGGEISVISVNYISANLLSPPLTITIKNDDGVTVHTITQSVAYGPNNIQIQKKFSDIVYLTIEYQTFADEVEVNFFNAMDCGVYQGSNQCDCPSENPLDPKKALGTGSGFGVFGTAGCSLDSIICANPDMFAEAMLYAAGIAFVHSAGNSDRFNRYTLALRTNQSGEYSKQLLDEFNIRYESAMNALAPQLSEILPECCFTCRPSISTQYAI